MGRQIARRKKLPVILSREEIAAIKACPNVRCPTGLRNRVIIEIMHRSGLRVSEVANLRRRHIIWDRKMLEVREGKGGVDRTIPLDEGTTGWLRAWDGRRPRGEYFFNTLKGGPVSITYIEQMVKRLARRAKIENPEKVTPHKFRHAFATEMLEDGFTLIDVQQLLGHSNIATTAIYLHTRPMDLAEKMNQRAGTDPPPENLMPKKGG